ncbi:MAG: hypothetical protein QM504_04580 [Pseudomonadota bacterium]
MSDNDKQKKLNILLGLSLTNKQKSSNCPDEEMIAAYFDHQLSDDENKKFLGLLNQCPESYSMWISMLETLEHHLETTSTISIQKTSQAGFIEHIYNWFSQNQIGLTGAIATTFLLLMVINVAHTPFTQLPIDQQIVKVWENNEVLDLAYVDISEFTPQALTKSSFNIMPFPEKVAFSSGFKQGLINMSSVSQHVKSDEKTLKFLNSLPNTPLLCNSPFCEKETWLNKQLGLWSSFALQECQQPDSSQRHYWSKQSIVIKHFLNNYQNLNKHFEKKPNHSNSLLKRVSKIDRSIQNLVTSQSSNKKKYQLIACNNIKQLAMYSIHGL